MKQNNKNHKFQNTFDFSVSTSKPIQLVHQSHLAVQTDKRQVKNSFKYFFVEREKILEVIHQKQKSCGRMTLLRDL